MYAIFMIVVFKKTFFSVTGATVFVFLLVGIIGKCTYIQVVLL